MPRKGIPIAFVLVLVLLAGACWVYWSLHPPITITRTIIDSNVQFDEEFYFECIMVIHSSRLGIPIADSVNNNLRTLADWNNEVNSDIYENYVAPLNITVSGEVKGGKTTFWYEGYATTHAGETIDYREEMTFDFVLVSNEKLFSKDQPHTKRPTVSSYLWGISLR